MALYRALEHRERGRPRLFDDPFAAAFLPPGLRLLVRAADRSAVHRWLCGVAHRRAPGARTSAIARTRFIDDRVRQAVRDGAGQVVLLGAGFDCRAHRLPELSRAVVFEVDRVETQAAKRAAAPAVTGERLRYVPVDFLRDDLGVALARAGWDPVQPAFFVWEGVTNYLTEAAVAAVLGWVGSTAAGSEVMFTYVHAGLLDGSVTFEGGARILVNVRRLARRGEGWTFGLDPSGVGAFVGRCDLELREDLGADEYRARYGVADAPATRGYAFYRVAVAAARPARRPKNVASAIERPLE